MKVGRQRAGEILRDSWLVVKESAISFLQNGGLDRSAALSYYCFLSLIPLLLLEVFVISRIIQSSGEALAALQTIASDVLPFMDQFIIDEVYSLSQRKTWGLVSVLLLLWAATPLASGIRSAFLAIFKTERVMPVIKSKLMDIAGIAAILAVFVAAALVGLLYELSFSLLSRTLQVWLQVAGAVAGLGGALIFLLLLYRLFVPVQLKVKYQITGAVVTIVFLSVVGPLFSFVLRCNPEYGVTFGSLKAVFLLFVWIYYSFVVVLLGTEIMANMARREALIIRGLFSGKELSTRSRKMLKRFVRGYDDGQTVFNEGDRDLTMFYVLKGAVKLVRGGQSFAEMKEGSYFGEMAMLLDVPRTVSAVASGPETQLVAISRENLELILKENPKIVLSLLQVMAARLKATNDMVLQDNHTQG